MPTDWAAIDARILGGLDLRAEAQALGLRIEGREPSPTGYLACHAFDREDRNPSATFNVAGANGSRGRYTDHATGTKLSFFNLAAQLGDFPDWKAARAHYAAKAGVELPGAKPKGPRKIVATYDYHDQHGVVLFQVVRFEPKDFRQRRPDGAGGWTWNLDGVELVPYQLPELLAADQGATVYEPEGEKDADRLRGLGLVATCNAGGAGKWRPEYSEHLRGRHVVVLADNDAAGRAHAEQVARALFGIAASVKVVLLPGLPVKGDVCDWLDAGGTAEALGEIVAAAPEWTPIEASADQAPDVEEPRGPADDDGPKKSAAALALEVLDGVAFWHAPDQTAFATVAIDGHHEHWPVRSQRFKRYVAHAVYAQHGKVLNAEALTSVANLCEARALFGGDTRPIFLRTAQHGDKHYLDLCDSAWRAVEIDKGGWRIVTNCPVAFKRSKSMLPLVEPQAGGSVELLRKFINTTDRGFKLIVAWLVAALFGRGPFPILALFAMQGSGKSTMARLLRRLVDPSTAPLRSEPREPRDLMIGAAGNWILSLDNLSHVPGWLSDCLCRLSTGGGFATRELCSNDDEIVFDAMRPVLLTSVVEVATRSDLLDRCLIVTLPEIGEHDRRAEADVWRDFAEVGGLILGGLLDAVAGVLRDREATRLPKLPRMADFATTATAAESALGWPAGSFMAAYVENRAEANNLALAEEPVAGPLLAVLQAQGGWRGTAGELLEVLTTEAGTAASKARDWPARGRDLSARLRRTAPNLSAAGWRVAFRKSGPRLIEITPAESRCKSASTASSASKPEENGPDLDAADAGPGILDAESGGQRPQRPPKNPDDSGRLDAADAVDAESRLLSALARLETAGGGAAVLPDGRLRLEGPAAAQTAIEWLQAHEAQTTAYMRACGVLRSGTLASTTNTAAEAAAKSDPGGAAA